VFNISVRVVRGRQPRRFFGFGRGPARADYGKLSKRSNRNLKKMRHLLPAVIKILHPTAGFGFILLCRDSRKLSRPS
jgi:hypothetical protein